MSINFKTVQDIKIKNRLCLLKDSFVDEKFRFKKEWLENKKFVAVPTEEAFLEDRLYELYAAVRKNNYSQLYIVLLNKFNRENLPTEVEKLEESYELRLNPDEFNMLRHLGVAANFVVFSMNLDFALLLTDAEFHVICGCKAFVEEVLGVSVQKGRKLFEEYAHTKTWSQKEIEWYLDMGKYYQTESS